MQAGIEFSRFKNIHLKADIFYHHSDESWYWDDDADVWDAPAEVAVQYITRLFEKLGVSNRSQAIVRARDGGFHGSRE